MIVLGILLCVLAVLLLWMASKLDDYVQRGIEKMALFEELSGPSYRIATYQVLGVLFMVAGVICIIIGVVSLIRA